MTLSRWPIPSWSSWDLFACWHLWRLFRSFPLKHGPRSFISNARSKMLDNGVKIRRKSYRWSSWRRIRWRSKAARWRPSHRCNQPRWAYRSRSEWSTNGWLADPGDEPARRPGCQMEYGHGNKYDYTVGCKVGKSDFLGSKMPRDWVMMMMSLNGCQQQCFVSSLSSPTMLTYHQKHFTMSVYFKLKQRKNYIKV